MNDAGGTTETAADGRAAFSAAQVVAAAYEGLLERAQDAAGRENYARLLRAGAPLAEILRGFVDSPEFGFGRLELLMALESLPPNVIQLGLSAEQCEHLWRHVQDTWSRLGRDEPYFSVSTVPEYRLANMSAAAIERFYDSGQMDLQRVRRYLARHGRDLPADGVCLDYGCGLGRVSLWLARHCRKVIAVDVSEAHLDIARRELRSRGVGNVEFRLLRRRDELAMLDGADFFYSVIVLQHNPPPIIVEILQRVLHGLNDGGAAFFQVPTYGFNYGWSYDRFLAKDLPAGDMEMHAVPQSAVFALAAAAGCVPIEVQPDGCAGMPYWMSNTFLFAKPGGPARSPAREVAGRNGVAARLLARLPLLSRRSPTAGR
jgi:SAM-dependent methyltransferase